MPIGPNAPYTLELWVKPDDLTPGPHKWPESSLKVEEALGWEF